MRPVGNRAETPQGVLGNHTHGDTIKMTTITDIVKRAAAAFILLTFTLSKKS